MAKSEKKAAVDYSDRFKSFGEKLKTETVQTPIQKTVQVRAVGRPKSLLSEEKQISVWVPLDMLKRLKIKAAEENTTVKDLINKAIEESLG